MAETLGQAILEVGLNTTQMEAGLKAIPGTVAATSASLPPLVPRLDGSVALGQFVTLKQQLERQAAASPLLLPVGVQQQRIAELQNVGKSGGFLAGLGLDFDELGKSALFAAGTLGVFTTAAGLANFSIKENVAYDDAAAAVRTLGVNSEELGGKLRVLSGEINNNVSTVDLLKSSYDVASSGFADTADAVDILKASALGATGGFSDINTVADATTSVLNAYGLSATNATKIVDGFIQTQNDGKITVGQIAQEIGRLAPTAAAAGVSFQELGAAVSVATAQGVPVGSTYAGLRQAIAAIVKPTDQAAEEAGKLGLAFNGQALQAQGLGEFLANVAEKTGGNVDANLKLFGTVEALAAIQPLLNDNLETYNKFLSNNVNQSGQAAKASETATNTITGSIKQFTNALSNIATQSDKAAVPVARLFQALTKITENLNKPADFAGRFTVLGQIVTNVQKQLNGLANNPAFKQLFGAAQREASTLGTAISGGQFGVGPEQGLKIERDLAAIREKRVEDEEKASKAARFAGQAAQRDIIRPAEQELAITQRLFGLDGERLRQARQALDVEKLRTEERRKEREFRGLGGNAAVREGSTAAITAKAELEAAGINVRTEIVKGADELRKAGREIKKQFDAASQGVLSATRGLQSAREARANATAAASDIASASAIREDRGVLLGDISSNLASGRVDQRRLAQRFGLGFNPNGGFVQGLEGLDINRLSEISRATSPLADSQTAVVEAQKELVKTQTELSKLREELKVANGRTSNLAITVPVGATRNIYLP